MITMHGLENKININRNGFTLDIIKDCNIYEVYYKNVCLGYFHKSRLENAIHEIINNGFYDGRNYDIRIQNVNEGKVV